MYLFKGPSVLLQVSETILPPPLAKGGNQDPDIISRQTDRLLGDNLYWPFLEHPALGTVDPFSPELEIQTGFLQT